MRQKINLSIVILMGVIIGYLSLTSNPPIDESVASNSLIPLSILGHFFMYFLLAGSLLTYFHDTTKGHIEAFLVAITFGVLMESLQIYQPDRFFSFKDIFVNCLGASIVFLDHRINAVEKIISLENTLISKIK